MTDVCDYRFELGAGKTMIAGKDHWPDLVRLAIPKVDALALAMDILRSLQTARPGEDLLMELPIFGRLERLEDN